MEQIYLLEFGFGAVVYRMDGLTMGRALALRVRIALQWVRWG
jgi:hypothetical protein